MSSNSPKLIGLNKEVMGTGRPRLGSQIAHQKTSQVGNWRELMRGSLKEGRGVVDQLFSASLRLVISPPLL